MANIDVTQLLTDPDFVDPVVIIHRQYVINEMGENVLTEFPTQTVGSVQPASGKTLMRLPDDLRIANVSSFWIKGVIVSDGKCQYPDIIVFNRQRYAVQIIFDWMNYGPGYCEGTCVREKPSL